MVDKEEIKKWWAENPMTYALEHGDTLFKDTDNREIKLNLGDRDFFEKSDAQLFEWNKPLHNEKGKFGKIFPYDRYKGKKVLEIGCGMGCMAMLWAQKGAEVTAIDLNPVSVQVTRRRFEIYNLKGEIKCDDANCLSYMGENFDYVYSWGVLHHSPNLEKSLGEMMRVLKSGGEYGIMLYNRRSIYYGYMIKYIEGFLHYEDNFLKPVELASRYGDGYKQEGNPHTWPVTADEVRGILQPFSADDVGVKIKILGTDLDWVFKLMMPGLGMIIPVKVKKVWARRFGWSLWISGKKK